VGSLLKQDSEAGSEAGSEDGSATRVPASEFCPRVLLQKGETNISFRILPQSLPTNISANDAYEHHRSKIKRCPTRRGWYVLFSASYFLPPCRDSARIEDQICGDSSQKPALRSDALRLV